MRGNPAKQMRSTFFCVAFETFRKVEITRSKTMATVAVRQPATKEHTTAAQSLGKTLDELYEKKVPQPVRVFIDSKAAAKAKRPSRPASKSAPASGALNKQEVQHEQ